MKCEECDSEKIETAAIMLAMGQVGAAEQMLILHTCECGHQWRGHA